MRRFLDVLILKLAIRVLRRRYRSRTSRSIVGFLDGYAWHIKHGNS